MVVLCTEEGAFKQYITNRISWENVPCIKLSTEIINRPCVVVVQSVRAKLPHKPRLWPSHQGVLQLRGVDSWRSSPLPTQGPIKGKATHLHQKSFKLLPSKTAAYRNYGWQKRRAELLHKPIWCISYSAFLCCTDTLAYTTWSSSKNKLKNLLFKLNRALHWIGLTAFNNNSMHF